MLALSKEQTHYCFFKAQLQPRMLWFSVFHFIQEKNQLETLL